MRAVLFERPDRHDHQAIPIGGGRGGRAQPIRGQISPPLLAA